MTLSMFVYGILQFSVIIFGILFCLIPVTKYLRFPPKKLLLILTAALVIFCPAASAFIAINNLAANVFLLPVLLLGIFLFFFMVNLEKQKLLYLFLCAVAMLSFGGIAGDIVDAMLHPNGITGKTVTVGLFVQYLISFLVLSLFFAIRDKTIWLFDHFHSKKIWLIGCTIPIIVSSCNIMMLPEDYAVVSVGRIFFIYLVIDISLFFIFLISQIIFYYVAKTITERQLAEKRILMYRMQESWYQSLNHYMEQTKRMRHDFRHIMITVGELVSTEQYDSLKQYYKDYLQTASASGTPQFFCSSASLNALLSYYTNLADDFEIKTQFWIQLPDPKKISDIDLGILFGNLLENAIYACKSADPADRYIHLAADVDTPGSFYITMANGFNGIVKERNGSFLSTKQNGSSTGLVSIRALAEKYHGTAEFSYKNKEFISNIMMNVTKLPDHTDE